MNNTEISYHVMFGDNLKNKVQLLDKKQTSFFFGQKVVSTRSTKSISFFQTRRKKLNFHEPTSTPEFSNLQ